MKTTRTFYLSILILLTLLALYNAEAKSQEKIVYNGVIDWEWSPRQLLSYGGNGFYWWHRPTESPGYITNYVQMPANDWKTPYDYENGTVYLRFEVIDQPTSSSFSIQLGIWQDVGNQKEVVSSLSLLSGGPGSSIQRSLGIPANWHQVFANDVDFTRPENFYRIGFVLWKGSGSCIPMAQGWTNNNQCANSETEALNFFPMRARVTVVAVAAGQTFSGWSNYPLPVATKPATPNYSIDFSNELTNKVVPSTDEYSYSSNMSGAISGTGQKLSLTPGQDVYFRTKANGVTQASDIQSLDVPARPATPSFTYDPVNQRTLTSVSNAHDYSTSASMSGALTGNGNFLSFAAGTSMYLRVKATSTAFKSNVQALYGTFSAGTTDCALYLRNYWKLEENNSGTFIDYAGSLDANVAVSPTRVQGKIDYAQYFTGLSEASLPDDNSFDWSATSSFSIEFWLNKATACPAQTTANNNVVIGRDDASTQLHWWAGVSCLDPGKINFNLIANNGSGQNLVSKRGVIDANWHHIAIVRDGNLGTTSIFIDGVRDTTISYTYTGDFVSSVPVNIGWLNLSTKYHLNATLDELALYNRAITSTEITSHYNSGNAISYCSQSDTTLASLKIMPLGNSITFDNNIVDTRPVGDKVAYRYHLYNLLNHAGYQFDFVGSEYAGFNYFPDAENAGFPGIRANQVSQLLNSGYNSKDAVQETPGPYLDSYLPDIVLLHIGTNSVQESAVDVENILNEIDAYKLRTGKDTKVIVARIINRQTYNSTTTVYNTNVANVVNNRSDPDLFLIDMENGAGINYATDMTDNLHPNTTGYQKMALNWFGKLSEILPQKTYAPKILIAPADTGTVNISYSSRVYAIGSPAPVFSLTTSPAGMSINSQTGMISWTPGSIGSYPVSILVSNAHGSETVSYTLNITAKSKIVGNAVIYSSTSNTPNRRAQPVTMSEDGTISSVAIYHHGGTGNMILAVYNTASAKPSQRIAVTPTTPVNATAGWQTVNLTTPVAVSQGQTIWLAWVFENMPLIRYQNGTPGRAHSTSLYAGGMPETFGSSSIYSTVFSVYANYYTNTVPEPPQAPSALIANAVSTSGINLAWTDNSNNEQGFIIERSVTSGSGFQLIYSTVADQTTYSDNGLVSGQTYYYRIRAFNNGLYSAYTPEQQATTLTSGGGTSTVGNTVIFSSSSSTPNRRAQPVTMSENGTISSIAIYHRGGSGNMILAVYNTVSARPSQRIAVTAPTQVNSTAGWQTVNLISPVAVSQGQTIWLAWVFENMPLIRYQNGTPGRAHSTSLYAAGMPETFGSSSIYSTVFSIYANYSTSAVSEPPQAPSALSANAVSTTAINLAWTDNAGNEQGFEIERSVTSGSGFQLIYSTGADQTNYADNGLVSGQTYYYRIRAFNTEGYSAYTQEQQATTPTSGGGTSTVGNTVIFSYSSSTPNRRAQPVTMTESGTISSIAIYHRGGTGNMILGIYNTVTEKPSQRIAVSAPTAVSSTAGWQTVNLITPVEVSQGQTIWLAWVFENMPVIRYTTGSPGRAHSGGLYADGMPDAFGSSSVYNTVFSIYANYTTSALKSTAEEPVGLMNALEKPTFVEFDVYPTLVKSGFNIKLNLPENTDVSISIYNVLGGKLMDILNRKLEKGEHHFYVDDLAKISGNTNTEILHVRLKYKDGVEVRKILLTNK